MFFFLLCRLVGDAQTDNVSRLGVLNAQLQRNSRVFVRTLDHQNLSSIVRFQDAVAKYLERTSGLEKVPESFLGSIEAINKKLKEMVDLQNFEEESIYAIIEDLNIKSTSASLALDKGKSVETRVKVCTRNKNNEEVSGYIVYWNYWIDQDHTKPSNNFQNPTVPCSAGLLANGIYDIWVKRDVTDNRAPSLAAKRKTTISPTMLEDDKTIIIFVP